MGNEQHFTPAAASSGPWASARSASMRHGPLIKPPLAIFFRQRHRSACRPWRAVLPRRPGDWRGARSSFVGPGRVPAPARRVPRTVSRSRRVDPAHRRPCKRRRPPSRRRRATFEHGGHDGRRDGGHGLTPGKRRTSPAPSSSSQSPPIIIMTWARRRRSRFSSPPSAMVLRPTSSNSKSGDLTASA